GRHASYCAERTVDPLGRVPYLVHDLVDRLVGLVRAQHAGPGFIQLPVQVSTQKGGPTLRCPNWAVGCRYARGRVIEGTQHSGNIPPDRVWDTALSDGLSRLALEVSDFPTGRRMQRLPEVKISMHALGVEHFGSQLIEAAPQPRNVRCQRWRDPGGFVQPIHHDHCSPCTRHLCGAKGRSQSGVNIGESSAQRLGFCCEIWADVDLAGLDLGRTDLASLDLR